MRKIVSLLSVLMLLCALAYGQARVVTGTVRDANGNVVPFATVTETGTRNAVAADGSGNYSIRINDRATLTISAAGFTTQQVTPNGTTANVSLVSGGGNLQEVVVTALGQTRSRAKVGYSATTVNNEQLNRASPTNPLDALAGRVAGANISKIGGPNSSNKVILRGFNYITAGNNPLYVIDGVPLSDARFGASGNYDFGQTISDLNPNDIETITVLKGTAAASLYGSQGKNGAILITTRRGRTGKLRVEYAGSVNFSRVGKLPEIQNRFGQGWDGTFILSENGSWGPKFDGRKRVWGSVVDNSQLLKPFSYVDDNIRDFYNTGVEYNNSVALSGGNDNNNFYFSYNNVTSDGVVPTKTDFFGRNTFALRTNSRFNKFTINSSFNYANRRVNAPFTGQAGSDGGSIFEEILQIPADIPIKDLRDYKNKFFNVDNYFTPFAENPYYPLYENRSTQNSDRFFGNVDLNYAFTTGLSAQLRLGGDFANARTFDYKAVNAPRPGTWNGPNPTNPEGASRAADVGSVREGSNYAGIVNGDFILKYNRSLSNTISLESLAGYNYFQTDGKAVSARITDLLIPGFYNLSNSTGTPTASDAFSRVRKMGVYAQAILGFKEQVYVTLNGRNDWSSTLPIENNSVFYPGANVSWVISQTLGLNNSRISLLKLRAGYGKTGSDPDPYLIDQLLSNGTVGLPFGQLLVPFNGVSGFGISNQIANASLKPIVTKEAEAGIEARMFNNRLGLDVTVYNKLTDGQIFAVPISPGSGYTSQIRNIGVIRNRGVELALDGRIVDTKNFTWATNFTFSKNWNKVITLDGATEFVQLSSVYDAEMRAYPGKNLFGMYAPVPQRTADGKIIVNATTGLPLAADEKGYYGNADYDYLTSLQNTFTFKGFQLSFLLDCKKGGIMYTGTGDLLQFTGNSWITTYNDRRPFIIPNTVVQTGTDASGKPTYAENYIAIRNSDVDDYFYHSTNKAMAYQNRFISRSFLKLRDVTLSYRLPQNWASKLRASNLSASLYGRNFLLWTPDSNVYIDPEATNLGTDIGSQFGEFRTAPTQYQIGFSLKAGF